MLRLSPFITVYCCAVAALLGACTGSFLAWSGVAHRPRGVRSPGALPLRRLRPCAGRPGLVPVFSYLLSGGKVPLLRRKALRPPCVGGADLRGGVREPAAPI